MTVVAILHGRLDTPNTTAFVYPIVAHRARLRRAGVDVRFGDANDADVVLVERRALTTDPRVHDKGFVEGSLEALRRGGRRVVWYDTTDSTGTLQTRALPFVDAYLKNQVLRDRATYLRPLEGDRVYTDHYARTAAVRDEPHEEPAAPPPRDEVRKLSAGWNSGLSDHSRFGPVTAPARVRLARATGIAAVLRQDPGWHPPAAPRPLDVTARFGTTHRRATVRHQREGIRRALAGRADTDRSLDRRAYWQELRSSKVMVSPFGWGEITLRDFESARTGCALMKPRMDHLETWPDLFEDGRTMFAFAWDLGDVVDVLGRALADDDARCRVAEEAQRRYRDAVVGDAAADAFARRFMVTVVDA